MSNATTATTTKPLKIKKPPRIPKRYEKRVQAIKSPPCVPLFGVAVHTPTSPCAHRAPTIAVGSDFVCMNCFSYGHDNRTLPGIAPDALPDGDYYLAYWEEFTVEQRAAVWKKLKAETRQAIVQAYPKLFNEPEPASKETTTATTYRSTTGLLGGIGVA